MCGKKLFLLCEVKALRYRKARVNCLFAESIHTRVMGRKSMQESTRVIPFPQQEPELIITDSLLLSFVLYRPRAFALASSLIDIVTAVLGWRVSARDLLRHILKEVGDDETAVELPHEQIGRAMWPHLKQASRKSAVSRALSDLKEDQYLSNFQALTVISGHIRNKGKSNEEKVPSRYQVEDFYLFTGKVSDRAGNEELLEKPISEANARFHRIVYDVLAEHKAVKINPADRKETQRKRKLKDSADEVEYVPMTIADLANVGAKRFEAMCVEMAAIMHEVSGYPDAKIYRDKLFKLFQVHVDGELESMRTRQKIANAPSSQRAQIIEMEKFKRENKTNKEGDQSSNEDATTAASATNGGRDGAIVTGRTARADGREPWKPGVFEDGTEMPF